MKSKQDDRTTLGAEVTGIPHETLLNPGDERMTSEENINTVRPEGSCIAIPHKANLQINF